MRFAKVLVIISVLFFAQCLGAEAGEDTRLYRRARDAARGGNKDFAFMHYRNIARNHPDSKYHEYAMFAKGEYYYDIPDFENSIEAFDAFLKTYPESKGRLFALVLLYRMALAEDRDLAEEYKKEIVSSKQVSFVFRDRKEYKYVSPMNTKFRAVVLIDRMEFYADGKLFLKIDY